MPPKSKFWKYLNLIKFEILVNHLPALKCTVININFADIVGGKLYHLTICPSAQQNLSTAYNLHSLFGYMMSKQTYTWVDVISTYGFLFPIHARELESSSAIIPCDSICLFIYLSAIFCCSVLGFFICSLLLSVFCSFCSDHICPT